MGSKELNNLVENLGVTEGLKMGNLLEMVTDVTGRVETNTASILELQQTSKSQDKQIRMGFENVDARAAKLVQEIARVEDMFPPLQDQIHTLQLLVQENEQN